MPKEIKVLKEVTLLEISDYAHCVECGHVRERDGEKKCPRCRNEETPDRVYILQS